MDVFSAKVSSRGQVTFPKPIREALPLTDREVVLGLDGQRVIVALGAADLEPPEPFRSPATTARVPWDAARHARLHPRGKISRRPRATRAPEPNIVVDLRTPAAVRSAQQ
jgi:hypothetical protein